MKELSWRQTGCKGIFTISFFALAYVLIKALIGPAAQALELSLLLSFATVVCLYGVLHILLQRKSLVTKPLPAVFPILVLSAVAIWIRLLLLPFIYEDWLVWQSAALLVCSLLGLLCLYRSASRIWASREGLVAAGLYAIWPAQLFFAQGDVWLALGELLALAVLTAVVEAYYAKSFRGAILGTILSALFLAGAVSLYFDFIWILPGLLLFFLLRPASGLAKELGKAHSGVWLFFSFVLSFLVFGAAALFAYYSLRGEWLLPNWVYIALPAGDGNGIFTLLDEQAGLLWQGELFGETVTTNYFFHLFYCFVLLSACLGTARLVRRSRADALPAVVYPLVTTAFLLFVCEPSIRSHMPLLAWLLLPAAYGLTARHVVPTRSAVSDPETTQTLYLDGLLREVEGADVQTVAALSKESLSEEIFAEKEEWGAPETGDEMATDEDWESLDFYEETEELDSSDDMTLVDDAEAEDTAEGERQELPEEDDVLENDESMEMETDLEREEEEENGEESSEDFSAGAPSVSEEDFAKSLDQVLSGGLPKEDRPAKKLPEIADVFAMPSGLDSAATVEETAKEAIPSKRDPDGRLLDELYNSGMKRLK